MKANIGGKVSSIDVESVPDEIYDTIVRAILDRALDPGTKLPEDVFCNHYGVSRTIVRVAIHRLEQDRLVEIQKNRGCFVLVPDRAEAKDILEARKAIEPFIIRKLAAAASNETIQALNLHVDLEDDAYHRNDQRKALRLSGQFHILLSEVAANNVLHSILLNLISRSALVIATYSDVTLCCKAHDHRKLVQLLKEHKADDAVQQMEHHLNDIERDLLQGKPSEEKPNLENVLLEYAASSKPKTIRRAG